MRTRLWLVAVLVSGWFLGFSAQPSSAQDLRASVERLASQVVNAAPQEKQFRVAVADFPDLQGVISDLGRYVANRLTTRLGQNSKFSVVERQRLAQVLAELKFSMSDLVDPVKAKRFGQQAGVDCIIVGAISDLGNQVEVDARMIEIETNQILLGETVTVSKDQTVTDMLGRGRSGPGSSQASPASSTAVATEPPSDQGRSGSILQLPKKVERKDFSFLLESCASVKDSMVCKLSLTNNDTEQREIEFFSRNSYLLDREGQQYLVEKFKSIKGETTGYLPRVEVPPGVPQPLYITFAIKGAVKPASVVTKWLRRWGDRDREFYVIFK